MLAMDVGAQEVPLLEVHGLSKSYPLMDSGSHKLGALWQLLRGQSLSHRFQALSDITFEVRRGQSLGLVGVNGAGKSTLLKLVAGVSTPSQGVVRVRGRVAALLELGAGFHPEYTGRENVYLAAALMGLDQAATDLAMDAILGFADIGRQIDQPLKHYSSGMVVRLGFAVATAVRPDLLITDEVLAVGDESFQRKCSSWMQSYLDGGGTLLLCSHSMYHIKKLCTEAAWIHEGGLRLYGKSEDVVREYLHWHESKGLTDGATPPDLSQASQHSGEVYHLESITLNGLGDAVVEADPQDDLLVAGMVFSPDGRAPVIASSIVMPDGQPVFGTFSELSGYRPLQADPHRYAFCLRYPALQLLPGRYQVRAHAMDPEGLRLFDQMDRTLVVRGASRHMGACLLPHEWTRPTLGG